MNTASIQAPRIMSGMRSTGKLHLGNYHGALKNWVNLQHEYECFFGIMNVHALTTDYEDPSKVSDNVWDMVIDCLAAGINPNSARIFIQSRVPEIAELHVLLSMITPLSWLERVPTYKDQQEKLTHKDLSTYGFLGYPLLQAADILVFKGQYVPVGEDQVPHLELVREIARRFNHFYGREPGYQQKAEQAIEKLGKKNATLYRNLCKEYQEKGEAQALETGRALVESIQHISLSDRERLLGYLEGGGKIILPEPEAMLTKTSALPGLDGRKMSKSYGNTIMLRDEPSLIQEKIKKMPTDPARVRRTDPGTPEKCPVWAFHKIYSKPDVQAWVEKGCTSAGIGCLDCKKPLIDAIIDEQRPICERAKEFLDNPALVRTIVSEGCEEAREVASRTITEVQDAMGLKD